MEKTTDQHDIRFQLWGWILFVFSALFFISSSIRAGDALSLIGGLFFLVSCLVFMVPLVKLIWQGRKVEV